MIKFEKPYRQYEGKWVANQGDGGHDPSLYHILKDITGKHDIRFEVEMLNIYDPGRRLKITWAFANRREYDFLEDERHVVKFVFERKA